MNTAILRSRILDMAIHGQLVPQDPSEGTAMDLLKEIAHQRGKAITPITDNVPFSIPDNWCWVKLGDMGGIVSARRVLKQDWRSSGIPFYRGREISQLAEKGEITPSLYIDESLFDKLSQSGIPQKDDLMITAIGTLGNVYVVRENDRFYYKDASVISFQNYNHLNPYFLKYILTASYMKAIINGEAMGTTVGCITIEKAKEYPIPLPPLSEQHRIVVKVEELLSEVDKIEQAQTDITQAATILRSRVLDMAISGKLTHSNTSEWEVKKIGDVAQYVNGRAFKPIEWESNGIPIIRIQNLNDKDAAYNYSTATYEDKYLIHNGDLLFAWAASLGVFIWDRGDAWLNQHIFRVLPYDYMDKKYFYYILQNLISEFYTQAHGSGMVHITKDKFENCPILLPPLSEQRRIVAKEEELFAEIDKLIN